MKIAINNIHLVGDPQKSEMRLLQVEGVMKQWTKTIQSQAVALSTLEKNKLVVFMCGDFNSNVLHIDTKLSEQTCELSNWFIKNGMARVPTTTSYSDSSMIDSLDHIVYKQWDSSQFTLNDQFIVNYQPNTPMDVRSKCHFWDAK